jgi:hypothetical protein
MRKLAIAGIALIVGVAGGYATATNNLNTAGQRTVPGSALWQELDPTEEPGMLPYSTGRFLADRQLPPPVSLHQYFRSHDEDGNRLRGDCAYVLEGIVPPARWWTIAATDGSWRTLAESSVAVSGQTFLNKDGSMRLTLSPFPVSGNWLKVPNETYQLVIALHDVADETENLILPTIRKGRC